VGRARDIRRCALQALYQFDAGGAEHPDDVRASLAESPGDERVHDDGFALARAAWAMRDVSDAAVAAITPDWPTHRQPVVDRSLLRLAWYEMSSGRTPPKVVINEAVELAKEFSTERSPMFINGVLDKLYRTLRHDVPEPDDDDVSANHSVDAPEGCT
jgi:N utilization substance protein B